MSSINTETPVKAETSGLARFEGLSTRKVHGFDVIVADHGIGRALALRGLDRESSPEGVLLPNMNHTHTYGMRFKVDLLFIDENWSPMTAVRKVESGHTVKAPEATHVLILPSDWDINKYRDEVGK